MNHFHAIHGLSQAVRGSYSTSPTSSAPLPIIHPIVWPIYGSERGPIVSHSQLLQGKEKQIHLQEGQG